MRLDHALYSRNRALLGMFLTTMMTVLQTKKTLSFMDSSSTSSTTASRIRAMAGATRRRRISFSTPIPMTMIRPIPLSPTLTCMADRGHTCCRTSKLSFSSSSSSSLSSIPALTPIRHCHPSYYDPQVATRLFSTSKREQSSTSKMTTTAGKNQATLHLADVQREFREAVDLYETNLQSFPTNVDALLEDLETEASQATFWDAENQARNAVVTAQLSRYSNLQSRRNAWTALKDDGQAILEMIQEADQEDLGNNGDGGNGASSSSSSSLFSAEERAGLIHELHMAATRLRAESERFRLELLLSGPYDDRDCRILITAGAGGTEANDWVSDLRRMYERHATKMGYSVQVEDSQPGDVVGFKSVELLVTTAAAGGGGGAHEQGGGGQHPYGWFKGEKGTHRMVRLSPFNANNKRQTTFAGVDVAPILDETDLTDVEIDDKDIEVTAMRSGGAGGQNVNKVNSAVRIRHLPSGLNVKCTQERSQAQNKELAMKRLKAQLLAIAREQRVQEIQQIRGDQVEASWGNQIRNYVLHPYKMIKDQRTGWETSNVQNFLDGDLEDCIAQILKAQAREEQEASLEEQ